MDGLWFEYLGHWGRADQASLTPIDTPTPSSTPTPSNTLTATATPTA
jgi:hypothetical protein